MTDQTMSDLEASFLYYWRAVASSDIPEPVAQYPFENYKIDFAWPDQKVAVELDGSGGGGYGRRVRCHNCGVVVRATKKDGSPGKELRVPQPSHGSRKGRDRDATKANALQAAGWVILRYTSGQLDDDPFGVIAHIEAAVASIIKIERD